MVCIFLTSSLVMLMLLVGRPTWRVLEGNKSRPTVREDGTGEMEHTRPACGSPGLVVREAGLQQDELGEE